MIVLQSSQTGKGITTMIRVGLATAIIALLTLMPPQSSATLQPEQMGVETLPEPQETWFMARDGLGSLYIFDSATGEMQGLLGISSFTPSVEMNLAANEFYAAESFYTRRVRGDRTDVVTIYDIPTLTAKKEIEVPNKIAALPFRRYIALMDDQRFLVVFNIESGHWMHDGVGLIIYLIQILLPFYFILRIRRKRTESVSVGHFPALKFPIYKYAF